MKYLVSELEWIVFIPLGHGLEAVASCGLEKAYASLPQ